MPGVRTVLRVRALSVLGGLGVLLGAGAFAQQPTFRARADLVQVDVVVVDKDGHPIRGLTQEAFAVRDRGKSQTISTFQEVGREPRAAVPDAPRMLPSVRLDVSSNHAAQSDRLVIMVVDDLHIWKGRTDRAKQISRDVVDRLGPASSMAVLFTSGDHNTNVTTDRSALLGAIDTLKARQSVRRPHPAIDDQRVPRIDPEEDMGAALTKMSDAGKVTAQDFFDNMQQYTTLRNAARILGGADVRRKAFVLVSEGIGKSLNGIFGAMAPQGNAPLGGDSYMRGDYAAFAASGVAQPAGYHDDAVLTMMEAMRRSNIATYAIDPRGQVKSSDLEAECFPAPRPGNDPCVDDSAGPNDWMSPLRQAQHGLEIMSEASGGFAVTNTDDFTGGLSRVVDDLDHYYLLGFYPTDPNGRGYRPLNVQVAEHPEWTLRYRRGYMTSGAPPTPKTSDPLVTLSAGILPKGDLPMRLTAIPAPGVDDVSRVTLGLEVSAPLAALQESDGKVRDTLKYEILVVDEKKAKIRSVGGLEGRLTLSPRAPGEQPPETVVYQVMHSIDVKPGHFEFRISATSAKLAKGGSAYLDVDVPDFRAAPIVLGGIALGYANGPHVPVAPPQPAPARGRGPGPAPAPIVSTVPFPPTLDRVFAASDTLRVYVEGRARATAGLMASLDVVDANGKVVASPSPSFTSGDPVRVAGQVPLQGLVPGPYLLRVTLSGGGQKAIRETGFAVKER